VTQYILYYSQLDTSNVPENRVTVPSSAHSAVIMNIGEGNYKFEVVTQAQIESGETWQSERSPSVIILAIVSANSTSTLGEL